MNEGEVFTKGSKVQTHSLTAVEYNYRTGLVTGSSVQKSGVVRIPVCLDLENGDKKSMLVQPKNLTLVELSPGECVDQKEVKECRCMFCGESMVLGSEEEAIAHMEVCPSLQEQLNDTENQFTLPSSMK
jgi:hypothetical protein